MPIFAWRKRSAIRASFSKMSRACRSSPAQFTTTEKWRTPARWESTFTAA